MRSNFSSKTYREWKKRDWMKWLEDNMDDDDDAYFTNIAKTKPFRLGHKMKVLKLSYKDDLYGIIVKVQEKQRVGSVPLCDLEVTQGDDRNYRLVKEYKDWFANR